MDTITFNDFMKPEIRIGKIVSAVKIEETEKLIELEVDTGKERRTLVAGIAREYEPDVLIGKEVPVLLNLEAGSTSSRPAVPAGSVIR